MTSAIIPFSRFQKLKKFETNNSSKFFIKIKVADESLLRAKY